MTERTTAKVFLQVRELLTEIMGQEQDLHDRDISLETSFNKDLELESIEFVVMFEKLQKVYGKDLNMAQWLASKELDEIIQIRVKDVVGFITQCQA